MCLIQSLPSPPSLPCAILVLLPKYICTGDFGLNILGGGGLAYLTCTPQAPPLKSPLYQCTYAPYVCTIALEKTVQYICVAICNEFLNSFINWLPFLQIVAVKTVAKQLVQQ